MPKARQLRLARYSEDFHDYWKESGRKVHGGAHAVGKRKTARPFDSKKPMHIVMRSDLAKDALSLRHSSHREKVNQLVKRWAAKTQVRIYEYANGGNHLHLLVRAKEKRALQRFLRTVSGLIARQVTGARKGNGTGKFWSALTFTRIAEWGKAFRNVKRYVIQNVLEAAGVIPYSPRKTRGPPLPRRNTSSIERKSPSHLQNS